ncbi:MULTISPECIES: MarR family winged helix-turn-helix transcriptional regulator [unclassified Bradyrhizobium]|uniref:MarR family winged helix-turn-helix transcriptional regulator n=1 Tax=unclassified Bradyrhizobium TaxID=2631580 RepID=UPI001BA62CEC|nr:MULTISPECIES: MarR family transcriptional regulator [unclassified Bradyrhizobium]MBR1226343.1 MarR family transcriptional regulator [Bradyrhizobium sp. AUGA SZCCT0176]MBR1295244.1 MarR family transcriptional regulator [Bradyrhizobium sp. AUGA SZCCT0042]
MKPTKSSNPTSSSPTSADPRPSDPKLADFLCFAVYSANLAFGRAYKPLLDELGLTYTQYIAIVALWENDNQTVSSLGEKLFLESNTLTPILKKLETMGYLRRQRDAADERQVLVSLTEAGRGLREKLGGRNLVKASGLSPEEFPKLQKAVVTVRNNLIKSMQDRPTGASASPSPAVAKQRA